MDKQLKRLRIAADRVTTHPPTPGGAGPSLSLREGVFHSHPSTSVQPWGFIFSGSPAATK